jgi:hypothetical protein
MKAVWRVLAKLCLAAAICWVVLSGFSAIPVLAIDPSDTPAPGVETPALIFFTPTADSEPSHEGAQAVATSSADSTPGDSSSSSGTPALVFFTPTTDPAASGTAMDSPQPATGGLAAGGAGTPTPQLTRVSIAVTPPWTSAPRPTRLAITPGATGGTPAPPAPSEAPFAQWPKGWWFAVGAVIIVIAIILAGGLLAR